MDHLEKGWKIFFSYPSSFQHDSHHNLDKSLTTQSGDSVAIITSGHCAQSKLLPRAVRPHNQLPMSSTPPPPHPRLILIGTLISGT